MKSHTSARIKKVAMLALFSAASVTLLFALPYAHPVKRTAKRPSGSSILLDTTFNAPFFATQVPPARGVLWPDGKYVLFWNIDTAADHNTGPLIRYNADGSYDNSFSFSRDYAGAGPVGATADGKLIVGASKVIYGIPNSIQHQIADILRLNGDGSIDSTFGPAQTTDGGEVRVVTMNNDGTILIGGLFTKFNNTVTHGIVRLLADGTLDPTFAPVAMTCPQFPFGPSCGLWADPVVDSDGKIIIAGDFIGIEVNGENIPRTCVARLNTDGSLDQTFVPSGFTPYGFYAGVPFPIRGIAIQSDGKIVIGGRFSGGNCNNQVPLVRLNADGSRDDLYIYPDCLPNNENGQYGLRNLVKDANDRIIAVDYSMWRFNTDGSLDNTFHNPVFAFGQQCCQEAFNVAFADGGTRLFVGGAFSDVDDVGGPSNGERWGAAKFSAADGSLDTSFTTSGRTGWKIEPNSFLRQADEFTLIGFARGSALEHYPAISHGFGRLFSTGALDGTFDPIASFGPPLGSDFVSTGFTSFPDGGVLVTGYNGATADYGKLLPPDWTQDTSFNGDLNVRFANAIPRADGKVVLSQYDPGFNDPNLPANPNAQAAVDGTEVQRINATGSLDNTFQLDPAIVAGTLVRDGSGTLTDVYIGSSVLTLTADNKIVFGYLHSDGSYHLVRLTSDGLLDPLFQGQTFPVQVSYFRTQVIDNGNPVFVNMHFPDDIPLKQAKNVLDNKVVLMGSFAQYGGTPAHGMLRINPNGSLDPSFSVGDGAQWPVPPPTTLGNPSVDNLEVGLNDKLLLTGTFEAFNNTPAPGIINLNPDGTIDPDFIAPVTRQIYDYQPAYLKRQPDGSFLLSGPYSNGNGYSPSFFRLLLPPGVPTPPGTDVTVDLGGNGGADDITVNFNSVQNAGTTSVELIDPEWAGELPPGYQIVGTNLAFEVWTTATYTPPVTVCFDLSSLDPATFAAARIFHNDGTGLVDVTSSKDPATQTICASVNSLSPFIVLRPTRPAPSPRPRPTPHSRPAPRL
ncbi:MAG TPA: delta-60 repeat domain-containing protein [Candidatus Udaeobacter sp.]|nr:delta-60 repeat domain-containing protein [Candidatus Udaeobacter sp.]